MSNASSVKRNKKGKITYSWKVKGLGWGIVAFEIVTIILWLLAVYGNGAVAVSMVSHAFGAATGGQTEVLNTTSGSTISVPVIGAGFFPVSVSVDATFLNNQNQTVAQVNDKVMVSPGQTSTLVLAAPNGLLSSNSTLSSYHVHADFRISSLDGLVGMGVELTFVPSGGGGSS